MGCYKFDKIIKTDTGGLFYPVHDFEYFTIQVAFRFTKIIYIVLDAYSFGNPVERYFDIFEMFHGETKKMFLDICANKLGTMGKNDTVEKNFLFQ